MTRGWTRRMAGVAVTVAVLAACSKGPADAGPPVVKAGGKVVFVSLGGSETAGSELAFPDAFRSRWTQLLYRAALPIRAVQVNLADDGRSVHDGNLEQLPTAATLHPTVATVWFGTYDEVLGTPVDQFESELSSLVRGLRGSGAEVFVATDTGTRYDDAIGRVVTTEKVTGVSVSGLTHPLGERGHAEVARRFERAVGKVR